MHYESLEVLQKATKLTRWWPNSRSVRKGCHYRSLEKLLQKAKQFTHWWPYSRSVRKGCGLKGWSREHDSITKSRLVSTLSSLISCQIKRHSSGFTDLHSYTRQSTYIFMTGYISPQAKNIDKLFLFARRLY